MLVKCTTVKGKEVFLNPDRIEAIIPDNSEAVVYFSSGENTAHITEESFITLLQKVNNKKE